MKIVMEEPELGVLTLCPSSKAQPLEKEINWYPPFTTENEHFLLGTQSRTGNR